ncbi:putative leucine-rich repeat-containing protein DDB_G0290503 [Onthophagus taurus]|uniref:putative leucine-rich repeat-containing protein DDB_G0290503 n=1 Tax=Onthophagus taurus TaxID=166361 RepID=UPI000C1FFAFF|nr:uncharacterized protein LOC111427077 [Onthophagus taurus]XP_022917818.1 uncharacterized protein LOC111427077 [Onthophagus taurus]
MEDPDQTQTESSTTANLDSSKQDETDQDTTIHGFNMSNVTVIEKSNLSDTELKKNLGSHEAIVELNTKVVEITIDVDASEKSKTNSCEGSDSGVEVLESVENVLLQRTHSANSENVQEFRTITPAQSYESSIVSYGSNYDEAYNILARRNSTLFEDYKLRNGDGTSEGGSESSSVASMRDLKRTSNVGVKKKSGVVNEKLKKENNCNLGGGGRGRIRLINQKGSVNSTPIRNKSSILNIEKSSVKTPQNYKNPKQQNLSTAKNKPDTLNLNQKKDVGSKKSLLKSLPNKTASTPSDDGRWPSNKPPLRSVVLEKSRLQSDAKNTLEKYATLPRRRREKSADNIKDIQKKSSSSRDSSMTRSSILINNKKLNQLSHQISKEITTPAKSLPPYPRRKNTNVTKTKIYHETSIQTALTATDIEKIFSGQSINYPIDPRSVEKSNVYVQVDDGNDELKMVTNRLKEIEDKYNELVKVHEEKCVKLNETENRLKEEALEKDGLKDELKRNTERVLAILGGDDNLEDENHSNDSLLMLESRFQNVSQVIINQETEISKLNAYCRSLQRDLDKSEETQRVLVQQQREFHEEGLELKNFMQEEKNALSDALKEAEDELRKYKSLAASKEERCKYLAKLEEQTRHEMYSMQARLSAIEAKGRELLVHQGSNVSGAAVALTGLISRLDGLLEELVLSYNISQQDLDDVVFHNEVYSNSSSSPEASPGKFRTILKDKTPSPKGGGSSFISAVINAIRNATSQTPFSGPPRDISRDTICTDNSNSSELLDSETEPCLMMEPVLEDVVVPDSHSHNMISSNHSIFNCSRLTRSESLTNFSILNRQVSSEQQQSMSLTESLNCSFTSDVSNNENYSSSVTLVDQVIEVDNLITKLLKIIRIVQMDNEQAINELQDERDAFFQQVNKHKDTNKVVVKQLQDWEILGARLKTEVKELMQQLTKKNGEIEEFKCELNNQHKEVEKLNQDVCELSTALSKSEHESKLKEEESIEALNKWKIHGDMPPNEILGRILITQNEIDVLKQEINEKNNQLNEMGEEMKSNKQLVSDHFNSILNESKKQYEVIDNTLGILHGIQAIINQHPELIQIQQDLEKVCMMSASSLPVLTPPPDYNANAGIIQAMGNLGVVPTINSTA